MRFIGDFTAVIGEAPLWSPEHDALFWIDTWQQKIMRARQPFHRSEVRDLPYRPACLARLPGRKLLVAYKEAGLASFDFDAGTSEELPLAGLAFERAIFNDGACDANGRLWIGTRDREATDLIGALYRIGSDLRLYAWSAALPSPTAWHSARMGWGSITPSLDPAASMSMRSIWQRGRSRSGAC
jgi:sugar lactone lactonase YvrE